jgi:hypothetical protein
VSESAVSAKPLLVYGLARNRRNPKRPPEPRPSGAHPGEGTVERRQRSFPLGNDGWLLGMGLEDTAGTHENQRIGWKASWTDRLSICTC